MVEHSLKIWPVYFDAVERGDKTFEVRRDDRGFQKGDTVLLQRTQEGNVFQIDYAPDGNAKHELRRTIVYRLTGFGIEPGYVVLGLKE